MSLNILRFSHAVHYRCEKLAAVKQWECLLAAHFFLPIQMFKILILLLPLCCTLYSAQCDMCCWIPPLMYFFLEILENRPHEVAFVTLPSLRVEIGPISSLVPPKTHPGPHLGRRQDTEVGVPPTPPFPTPGPGPCPDRIKLSHYHCLRTFVYIPKWPHMFA